MLIPKMDESISIRIYLITKKIKIELLKRQLITRHKEN